MAIHKLVDLNGSHFVVGLEGVKEIIEHPPQGEGDRWFYDVHVVDTPERTIVVRVFTPDYVEMDSEDALKTNPRKVR